MKTNSSATSHQVAKIFFSSIFLDDTSDFIHEVQPKRGLPFSPLQSSLSFLVFLAVFLSSLANYFLSLRYLFLCLLSLSSCPSDSVCAKYEDSSSFVCANKATSGSVSVFTLTALELIAATIIKVRILLNIFFIFDQPLSRSS